MRIIDKVKEAALNQLIEVIDWRNNTQDTLLYRFPVYQQETRTAVMD